MPLSSGARLGPYEILAAIGAGGMGEVYKARDTRLDRTVAIKVLPPEVSADPERRARFEREAKTIAGLNHPHICTLHDVGEHEGSTFLVMEHLTGETLAARLEKGPLPLEQALTVATEIADALAAAHRQGVIHRDLKPGNVMLTKTGAKLLDFGLAKLKGHGEQPAAAHLASAPTQSTPLTGEGMIVGTLQYMAPEQLEGKPADARTDLWALGAMLYEMVTGKRAFEGTSAASLIAAILDREPTPLSTHQPLTPPGVDRLVRQCLAKSPEDRPDTAHDVANDLRWLRETSGVGALAGVRPRRARWRTLASAGIFGLAAALAGAGVTWLLRPAGLAPVAVVRTWLDVRPAEELNAGGVRSVWLPTPGGSRTALAWTPDGDALVFVGRRAGAQRLYVRPLKDAEAHVLAGTDGAQLPVVSPDGRSVAFWAAGAINKMSLSGGPAVTVATDVRFPPRGMAWGSSGRLVYANVSDGLIWQADGSPRPKAVTRRQAGEMAHVLPQWLPGDAVLLYTVLRRELTWGDEQIVAQDLATNTRKILLEDAADARYVRTGHLVFLRRGLLLAVAFDIAHLEVSGEPVPVLADVAQALASWEELNITGAGQFSAAGTGALAFVTSAELRYPDQSLVAVDRRGRVTRLSAPVRGYGSTVRLSPDGRRLAVAIEGLTERSLWLRDFSRSGSLTKLTPGGEAGVSYAWTPDGQRLTFEWGSGGIRHLVWQRADGSALPERLSADPDLAPSSWSPDGQQLAAVKGRDIWVLALQGAEPRLRPVVKTAAEEGWPEFSPDGRWLAFASDASGRQEVYVQPYPGPGGKVQVSVEGGHSPAWNPNGRELFFTEPQNSTGKRRMMAVDVQVGPTIRVGTPRPLFEFLNADLGFACMPVRCYDVAPDGQRFYIVQTPTPPPPPVVTRINLILNWAEELKAKVPTGR